MPFFKKLKFMEYNKNENYFFYNFIQKLVSFKFTIYTIYNITNDMTNKVLYLKIICFK